MEDLIVFLGLTITSVALVDYQLSSPGPSTLFATTPRTSVTDMNFVGVSTEQDERVSGWAAQESENTAYGASGLFLCCHYQGLYHSISYNSGYYCPS